MGFGNFLGSESKTNSTNTAADNEAVIVSGKGGAYIGAGSVSVGGKGAKYISPNSIDLSGAMVSDSSNRGLLVQSGADVGNITIGGGEVAAEISKEFSDTIRALSTDSTQAISDALASSGAANRSLGEKLAGLISNQQTGGLSPTAILVGLALVALVFLWGRKA